MSLEEALDAYYAERPEFKLDKATFSGITAATNFTFDYYLQEKARNPELEKARSVRIVAENMLGYVDQRRKALDNCSKALSVIAAEFLKTKYDPEDVIEASLMVNGSTLPLEVRLNGGKNKRTIFLKKFDLGRLLGLEIYSLISGSKEYNYAFNQEMIVEREQEGEHEFEYSPQEFARIKASRNYIQNKVKLDLISFYMGLDDVMKKDNYLVTRKGDIRIIDFDVMDRDYSEDEIMACKEQTAKELGITSEEYKKIYDFQEFLLKQRVKDNREKINILIDLSKHCENGRMHKYLRRTLGDIE